MYDVEEFHHSRAIVCDCLFAILVDEEEVTAVRSEGSLYCGLDG